jgi:hypothetical protein
MTALSRPPGQPLQPFLNGLPADRLRSLLDHAGGGLFNARHAAQCVTEAGTRHHQTVPQLLVYLATAIRELDAARAIVTGQMEGGEVTR